LETGVAKLSIAPTNANPPPQEPWPAFQDDEGNIKVLEGKTLSKGNGWWSGILLIDTYGKLQVKWYLWQQRSTKDKPGVMEWKKKQSFTINPMNWLDSVKITNELLEKKKTAKATTAAFQRRNP
jgi:hypothetical protein